MHPLSSSFTTIANGGLLNVLKNQCGVSQATTPPAVSGQITHSSALPEIKEFTAIWDTGATNSVITQNVVNSFGLQPITMTLVSGVGGDEMAEVYLVNIYLPNKVLFPHIRVTKGKLRDADMLIGMDIMNQGDFAVTNRGGITKFSFRVPSEADIDFVQQHRQNASRVNVGHNGINKKKPKRHKTFGKNKRKKK